MAPSPVFHQHEDEYMQDTLEKTPGVYVRTEEHPPHELDMLWSGTRNHIKEERSPFIFFAAGLILGVLVTSAVFILIINKPKIQAGISGLTPPVVKETPLIPQGSKQPIATTPVEQPLPTNKVETPVTHEQPLTTGNTATQVYTVVEGDNLSAIAQKAYGTTSPTLVEKIQRANKMDNPNSLSLGQKLVIPPQNY